MPTQPHVVFYHSPRSRSEGVRRLIEELSAKVDLKPLNLRAGENRQPSYLRINPMGKVPAIVHDGALVTEQPAIYQYLAELFPEAGLHVPAGDPLRGPYLRWLAFYGSSFEPALLDRALKREAAPAGTAGHGDFDSVFGIVAQQLESGPWLLGERFTAADVLWGSALHWLSVWKMLPEQPAVQAYLQRVMARPAIQSAVEKDNALAKEMGLDS
jgi:glutathione S-transferase